MLYANRNIQANEQITIDYKTSWETYNIQCHCGSEECSGYLNGNMKNKKKIIQVVRKDSVEKRPSSPDPVVDEQEEAKEVEKEQKEKEEEEPKEKKAKWNTKKWASKGLWFLTILFK